MAQQQRRHSLGPQAWVRGDGEPVPSASFVVGPRTARHAPHKPGGGIWTSTYSSKRGSAWLAWCLREDFGGRPFDLWVLDPHRRARVYVIASRKDALRLQDAYPATHDDDRRLAVDWVRVSQDFDAVHVTERGLRQVQERAPKMPEWHCESAVWFRWSFVGVKHVGTFEPRSR